MENKMNEFLKSIGITQEGSYENDSKYVVELVDSNEYSKAYSILDKSDKVDLDTDLTLVSNKMSELTYLSDEYDIKLIANFADDIYKIIVTPGEDL